MDPRKEKAVAWFLAIGAVISFCSLPLMWMFALSGVFTGVAGREPGTDRISREAAGTLNLIPLMMTVFMFGLLFMIGSVWYGLAYTRRSATGARRVVADALVQSRYAMTKSGDLLMDSDVEFAEDPRFYVRMLLPDGTSGEYPVAPETYFNCAEGMPGEVELQGRWVGRFTPYIGPRPNGPTEPNRVVRRD